jgi:hypothetical protein
MRDDTEHENRQNLDAIDAMHSEGLLDDAVKRKAAAARDEPDPDVRADRVDQLVRIVRERVGEHFDRYLHDVVRSAGDTRLAGVSKAPSANLALKCLTCGFENHLPYVPTDDDPEVCQNPDANVAKHPLKVR